MIEKMATECSKNQDEMSDKSAIQVDQDSAVSLVPNAAKCSVLHASSHASVHPDYGGLETPEVKGPDPNYKDKHPIGSRKVTESVITYHEPIFQSMANTLFESKKNLAMGKRKFEDEGAKGEDSATSPKRKKLESNKVECSSSPHGSPQKGKKLESNKVECSGSPQKGKKKCSIENIVERIRKEKTLSRSGNSPTKSEMDNTNKACDDGDGITCGDGKGDNQQNRYVKHESESSDKVEGLANVMSGFNEQQSDSVRETKSDGGDIAIGTHKTSTSITGCDSDGSKDAFKCMGENKTGETKSKKKCVLSGDKPSAKKTNKIVGDVPNSNKGQGQTRVKNKKCAKDNDKPKIKKKAVDKEIKPKIKERKKKSSNEKDCEKECIKKSKVVEGKSGKASSPKKTDVKKRQKAPIAQCRKKREASLNASTFMNIMFEIDKKSPTKNAKRSKSDSDLLGMPSKVSDLSCSVGDLTSLKSEDGLHKQFDIKAESFNQTIVKRSISKDSVEEQKFKTSPKRKISFSDECLYETNADSCKGLKDKKKPGPKKTAETIKGLLKSTKATVQEKIKNKLGGLLESHQTNMEKKQKVGDKKEIKNKKKSVVTIVLSPEEVAEKKRKANLARIRKANELMNREKLQSAKSFKEEETIDIDSDSTSVTEKFCFDEDTSLPDCSVKKVKAKRGELFRAARTHVSVEHKLVPENNPSSSPKWCDCCQSSYYPSPPQQQSHQFWRTRQLVDRGSSSPPEPIQSSSRHFIAAHTHSHNSCDVRPYSSPTHVPVLDSSAYVTPLVQHGHVSCSACGCGHAGMLHAGQCQNYSLAGIGSLSNVSMLSCQHYTGSYPMPYPHGSYTHCGCTTCCSCGSFHAAGQPLLHQPQMSMSPETSILLHRPVQLQMAHDAPHSMTIQCSRAESSLPTPHQVSMQLGHGESSLSSHPHGLQMGHPDSTMLHHTQQGQLVQKDPTLTDHQGEVTNMTISRSNSMSDHEFIDVGKDEVVKSCPSQSAIISSSSSNTGKKSLKATGLKKKSESTKKKGDKLSVKGTSQSCNKTKLVKKVKQKLNEPKNEKSATNKSKLTVSKQNSDIGGVKKSRKPSVTKDNSKTVKKIDLTGDDKSVTGDGGKKVKAKKDPAGVKKDPAGVKKDPAGVKKDQSGVKEEGEVKKEVMEVEEEDEEKRPLSAHGWEWHGEGTLKTVVNIFDGLPVQRKCYNAICHDDGEVIQAKDCILVCSGRKKKDVPYVAKVTNFWEDPVSGEMMMTVLWYYRPEHTDGGRKPEHKENEVFAAKHRDETLVACIDDKGYVLTYNEYCRFMAEVQRTKYDLPPRKKVVPDPEEPYPEYRIPPVDVDPENVLVCRQVYDFKLKRLLKNPS